MTYRFYIDGTLYQEEQNVSGWNRFETTIQRNASQLKGILQTQGVELVFIGDIYTYLYDKLYNEGFCTEIEIEIHQSCDDGRVWQDFFTGIFYLSDISFNEKECEAKTKIQDRSYYARINNNKSIDTALVADRSKNDLPIDSCPIYDLIRFNVNNGNYNTSSPRQAFRVYDVFKYLIAFMSDGEMGFESEYLEDTTDDPEKFGGLFISNGFSLRTTAFDPSNNLRISFQSLYEEVSKLAKISFAIEYQLTYGGLTPVLRIENDAYWFSQNELPTLRFPNNVITKTKSEELFSKLRLGSEITVDAAYVEFPEGVQFVGFKDETYHILGQCNLDNTLDLGGRFIRSSNVIEDCIEENNPAYDEDIFFIYCNTIDDVALTCRATQKNWISGAATPQYYNFELTNSEVAQRYLGAVPNSIITFIGDISADFQANKISNESHLLPLLTNVILDPFVFTNDFAAPAFDSGGNYNTGTSEYTIPAGGTYSFELFLEYSSSASYIFRLVAEIRRYDAGGVAGGNILDSESQQFDFTVFVGQIYNHTISASFNCNAGEIIACYVRLFRISAPPLPQPTLTFFTSTYFKTTATFTGGGTYMDYDPLDYKVLSYEFNYPLTKSEFEAIQNDPTAIIPFDFREVIRKGWIDVIKYNHLTQIANIKLISSINAT